MIRSLIAASLLLSAAPVVAQDELAEAREILAEAPIFDGHNDLPFAIRRANDSRISDFPFAALTEPFSRIATDGDGLIAGGVGAQFWSVYVPATIPEPEAAVMVLEQIDLTDRLIAQYPDRLAKADTAADVRRIMAEGKVAGMYGVEGGHAIANSLPVLRKLYDLGARYMTLTHSKSLDWVDSATDVPKSDGLSPFGEEVVREMNRLGMLVDLSHVSEASMNDALDVSEAPVIFSHSSARAVTGHPRNVPDAVLQRLPENGGVIMITYVEGFVNEATRQWWGQAAGERTRLETLNPGLTLEEIDQMMRDWREANPAPKATLSDVADHIDHVRDLIGVDYIGIGGDYDGIPTYPTGLEDVSTYPALFAELLRRGYSRDDLAKISSGNVLRVLEQAEAVAARLQSERGPSEMRFPEE
ncbi:MAG: dipeptidase [Pacificimonas sp.]|nr:dipeptidase [Pacificimonas sp.]